MLYLCLVGALGSFTMSDTATGPMSWEQTSDENQDYGRDTNADCYFVAGTRASIAVPTMRIWENSGDESCWFKPLEISKLEFEEVDPLVQQLLHFSEVSMHSHRACCCHYADIAILL